ncbi:TadE/TadG family type IV pilus assembly protein [Sulfitobacter sabulilitoris]|uniref:Pilus assembly protein n=1 Tax=Sulfitobacter sabulilitoris TaxID=2562655 RepID=A0A5S3PJQ3_9RHOB|nr:TadE/TadG family type IV pilus assembly protein [Sulfitobacter sabulilitoris]TMM54629.1 pilus assembly protein [Sulfitobacter sabulilitoris]
MMSRRIMSPARFATDEDGATMVEFAVVLAIFLLLVFGLIDFGRLGFSYVMAEKATERAARIAVVNAPVCTGLADVTTRGVGGMSSLIPNGTSCGAGSAICSTIATVTCRGTSGNATAARIWSQVQPLLPVNATPENLEFAYSFDPALNRLGAPYAPIVSVDIVDLQFQFISPLGAFAAMAGATQASDLGATVTFPSMSASLPSEDLR